MKSSMLDEKLNYLGLQEGGGNDSALIQHLIQHKFLLR